MQHERPRHEESGAERESADARERSRIRVNVRVAANHSGAARMARNSPNCQTISPSSCPAPDDICGTASNQPIVHARYGSANAAAAAPRARVAGSSRRRLDRGGVDGDVVAAQPRRIATGLVIPRPAQRLLVKVVSVEVVTFREGVDLVIGRVALDGAALDGVAIAGLSHVGPRYSPDT